MAILPCGPEADGEHAGGCHFHHAGQRRRPRPAEAPGEAGGAAVTEGFEGELRPLRPQGAPHTRLRVRGLRAPRQLLRADRLLPGGLRQVQGVHLAAPRDGLRHHPLQVVVLQAGPAHLRLLQPPPRRGHDQQRPAPPAAQQCSRCSAHQCNQTRILSHIKYVS